MGLVRETRSTELSTTEIYTRVNIKHLEAVHTATHPGANPPGRRRPRDPTALELTGKDLPAILEAEARRDEPQCGGR